MSELLPRRAVWHVFCDDFYWPGWALEGAKRVLGPAADDCAWKNLLANPPESRFLLIESGWEGFGNLSRVGELKKLAAAFRQSGIPVVFWNAEDPAHFKGFLQAAISCDAILTTDAESVPEYRGEGFKGPVEVLTFPAHPEIHRDYTGKHERAVLFAGSPAFQHADRRAAFHYFLKPALQLGCVDIIARAAENGSPQEWPEECRPFIKKSLSHSALLEEYSFYKIGLSMSSCPASPTMYPLRIVELPMAGVLPVSDNCRAVQRIFPEIPTVCYSGDVKGVLENFLRDTAEREARVKALKERILSCHTYAAAFRKIEQLLKL